MTIYTILAFIINFALKLFMLVLFTFTFSLKLFGLDAPYKDFQAWREKFNDKLKKENKKSRARHARRKQNEKNNSQ